MIIYKDKNITYEEGDIVVFKCYFPTYKDINGKYGMILGKKSDPNVDKGFYYLVYSFGRQQILNFNEKYFFLDEEFGEITYE